MVVGEGCKGFLPSRPIEGRRSFLLGPIEIMASKIVAWFVVSAEAFGSDIFSVDGGDVGGGDGMEEQSASIDSSEFCFGQSLLVEDWHEVAIVDSSRCWCFLVAHYFYFILVCKFPAGRYPGGC